MPVNSAAVYLVFIAEPIFVRSNIPTSYIPFCDQLAITFSYLVFVCSPLLFRITLEIC